MRVRKIVFAGVFTAFGILLPYIFHIAFGMQVSTYLNPMHYAAFFAGGFFGPIIGTIVGFFTVVISHLLTGGMPPAPIYYFMMFEVPAYGLAFGLLYYRKRFNIYFSLIVAMIFGRVVSLTVTLILGNLALGGAFTFYVIITGFVPGLVSVIPQLIIIPIVVERINKVFGFNTTGLSKLEIEDEHE